MNTKENIKPGQIAEELNRLWKAKPNADVMKACLFNLIVYSHNQARLAYFKDLINAIMDKFPCRVLFVQGDLEAKDSYLKVHVSTEFGSHPNSSGCDYITLEVSSDQIERIPFIILPNLVSDLPIYLLWGEDPTQSSPILAALEQLATRVIFDSEWTKDLQRFCQVLLDKWSSHRVEWMDMNWIRISGWREILSLTFDSPERLNHLILSKSITITYNGKSNSLFRHPETQALYLHGWLAVQLGWNYQSSKREEDKISFYYQAESYPIEVHLQPASSDKLEPEEIIKIEIEGRHESSCSLVRQGSSNQVVVHCSTEYQCDLPFTLLLPSTHLNRRFIKELFYRQSSQDYLNTLNLISQME